MNTTAALCCLTMMWHKHHHRQAMGCDETSDMTTNTPHTHTRSDLECGKSLEENRKQQRTKKFEREKKSENANRPPTATSNSTTTRKENNGASASEARTIHTRARIQCQTITIKPSSEITRKLPKNDNVARRLRSTSTMTNGIVEMENEETCEWKWSQTVYKHLEPRNCREIEVCVCEGRAREIIPK